MATKANDFLEETTYSISNPKTDVANTDLTSDADYVISGDAMSSITSRLATQSFQVRQDAAPARAIQPALYPALLELK